MAPEGQGSEAVLGSVPASCRALAGLLDAAARRTSALALGIAVAETLAFEGRHAVAGGGEGHGMRLGRSAGDRDLLHSVRLLAKGMARPESLEPAGAAESPLTTRHMAAEAAACAKPPLQ